MTSIWKEPREGQKAIRHVVFGRVALEVTAGGRGVSGQSTNAGFGMAEVHVFRCGSGQEDDCKSVNSDFTTNIFYTNTCSLVLNSIPEQR